MRKRYAAIMWMTLLPLALPAGAVLAADTALRPFTSDGCSLFPDGTANDRALWCGCCFTHDIAYWQGGTAEERQKADSALRDCVLERTKDKKLAEAMLLGVRAGGHPASVMWYRWGYGWEPGRGYKPLTETEKNQAAALLGEYRAKNPGGYCEREGVKISSVTAVAQRPAAWAAPVPSKNLKNFYRLDDKVYRSAQPDKKGFAELKERGILSILSLREYHSDGAGRQFGLNLRRVQMDAGKITTEQAVEALRYIKDAQGPVLIHCWHGSDRTGTISALYRIVFQGWSKEAALDELVNGGYGYHSIYKNIPEFIRQADIPEIKRQVFAGDKQHELP